MQMKKVVLSAEKDQDLVLLRKELQSIEEEAGKVYKTAVHDGIQKQFFVTTNKDIHLFLGRVSEVGKLILARCVVRSLAHPSPYSSVMISKGQASDRVILATISSEARKEDDLTLYTTIIHLSPVN